MSTAPGLRRSDDAGAGLAIGVASAEFTIGAGMGAAPDPRKDPGAGGNDLPMSSRSSIICCCRAALTALWVIAAPAKPVSDIQLSGWPVEDSGGAV